MMLNQGRDIDLDVAELLVCADFLKPFQLDRAYASCRDEAKPLSYVLLESRMIDEHMLFVATEVVKEIHSGRLPKTQGRTALYLMGNCGLTMDETYKKLGINKAARNPWFSQLDELESSGRFKAISS